MDESDIVVDDEEKQPGPEEEKVAFHGYGVSPEHETLIGIYHCAWSTDNHVKVIREFVDRVDFFFELLYYALFGAIVGWLIGTMLKVLHLF